MPVVPFDAPAVISLMAPQVIVMAGNVVKALEPVATLVASEIAVVALFEVAAACAVPAGPANSSAIATANDATTAEPYHAYLLRIFKQVLLD